MVYYDQKRVKATGKRKVSDEIVGDLLEGKGRVGSDGRKRRGGWMSISLILLADGATGDVFFDELRKSRPPIPGSY